MALNYRELTPSEDVRRNLERSRRKAALIKTREVRCPYCKRIVAIVPIGQTDMMFPKCQKCKFSGPLDPRYFRRMRTYQDYLRKPKNRAIR